MLSAALRQIFADWWLVKGDMCIDLHESDRGEDIGGDIEPLDADGEGVGPPVKALHGQEIDLWDSWSVSSPSVLDWRSQCFVVKTATSKNAQYRWHLILALLILMRAMHRRVRETTSSDESRGEVVEDCRIHVSAVLASGSRYDSSSRIFR